MLMCGDKDCKGTQKIVSIGECVGDLTAVYAEASQYLSSHSTYTVIDIFQRVLSE